LGRKGRELILERGRGKTAQYLYFRLEKEEKIKRKREEHKGERVGN